MCGIFAYIGSDEHAVLKAVRGIKDLEYRGYDSWGVAVKTQEGIVSKKAIGKISDVRENEFASILGTSALGHTRWATHGGVVAENAHPHFNRAKTIAVVHNGIIENHEELKEEVGRKLNKSVFQSGTDTEVVPHLIDMFMEEGLSFEDAFRATCKRLHGRFAFVALHADFPFLLAARNGSPLLVGKGDNEYFIASDTPAFLDYTRTVHYVDDGECLRAGTDGLAYFNYASGKRIAKKESTVTWKKSEASKGGWDHFMLKEIMEQGERLECAIDHDATTLEKAAALLRKQKLFLTGAGTAGHVSMIAEYFLSRIVGRETRFVSSAEFHKDEPFFDNRSVLVAVTQSGETADLLEAIKTAKAKKGKVMSVLNVRGSSVERESDLCLPINAGPEIAVASTKAATGQLATLLTLSLSLAGLLPAKRKELEHAVGAIRRWLTAKQLSEIKEVAAAFKNREHLFAIGKSVDFPVALEAALKIKEVSYMHAEGFASGELKHGPIALIEEGTPCLAFVPTDEFRSEVISSAEELKTRGGFIIGISPERDRLFDRWIQTPETGYFNPIANIIAAQILAYYLAVLRGIDPDKPRNLAKSVTVK